VPRHRARLDVGSGPLLGQLHPGLSVLAVAGDDARALVAAQLLAEGLGHRPTVRFEELVLRAGDLPAPPDDPDRPASSTRPGDADDGDPLIAERRNRHADRVRLTARRAALSERSARTAGDPRAARSAWLGLVVAEQRADQIVAGLHQLADEWDDLLARLAEDVLAPTPDELEDARIAATIAAEAAAVARSTAARAMRAREEVGRLDRAHAELVELERVDAERRTSGDPRRRRAVLEAREARLLVQVAAATPDDDVDALHAELAAVRDELDHPRADGPELPSPREARRRRRKADAEARAALARVGVARADQLRGLAASSVTAEIEDAAHALETARRTLSELEERAERARSDAPLHAAIARVRAYAATSLGVDPDALADPAAVRAAATPAGVVEAAARQLATALVDAGVDDGPDDLAALVVAATTWLGEQEQRAEERARLEIEIGTLDEALVRLHAADAEFVLLARVAELRRLDPRRRTPVVCDAVVDATDPARRLAILGLLEELAEIQRVVLLTGSEVVEAWAAGRPAATVGCFDVAVARAGSTV
jgi:hypothetical protein